MRNRFKDWHVRTQASGQSCEQVRCVDVRGQGAAAGGFGHGVQQAAIGGRHKNDGNRRVARLDAGIVDENARLIRGCLLQDKRVVCKFLGIVGRPAQRPINVRTGRLQVVSQVFAQ